MLAVSVPALEAGGLVAGSVLMAMVAGLLWGIFAAAVEPAVPALWRTLEALAAAVMLLPMLGLIALLGLLLGLWLVICFGVAGLLALGRLLK
jgi:hypothetical protein